MTEDPIDALHLKKEEIYKIIEEGPTLLKIGKFFVRTNLEYCIYSDRFLGYRLNIYQDFLIKESSRTITLRLFEDERFKEQYWAKTRYYDNIIQNTVVYDIIKWLQVLTKIGCFC